MRFFLQILHILYYKLPYFRGKSRVVKFMASPLSLFRGEVATTQGFKWTVDDMDTFWTWVLSCERFAIQTFTILVKNCDYFIDIGANRGYYSLVALANSSNVKVDSIEANLQTSKILRKNLDNSREETLESWILHLEARMERERFIDIQILDRGQTHFSLKTSTELRTPKKYQFVSLTAWLIMKVERA